ncbi:MAG: diguanylate cyclase [bacterium]|nr:diguanylate cyclase [bacterium]
MAIAAPTVVDPWIYLIVGALAVVVAGSVVWMLGDSIRRRRPFSRLITAAVAVIGLGGLADLLSALGLASPLALNVGGLVFPLAFVPFYAVMAGIFVYGYWRSYRESTIDTLTGLMQRHFFLLRLGDEVARAVRSEQVLTVAMIDLDKFKSINDTLSHSVGDRVLRATSQAIKGATRQFDLVGRYGGDELCLAMSTSLEEEALAVLERVRSSVEAQRVTVGDQEVGLTISVGAVMCDHCVPDMSHTRLMELADTAVYRAKAEGGNRLAVTRIEPDASSSSIRRIQLDPVIE